MTKYLAASVFLIWAGFMAGAMFGTTTLKEIESPFWARTMFDPTPFDKFQPLQVNDFCGIWT